MMIRTVMAAAGLIALAACGGPGSGDGNGSAAAGAGGASGVQLQPGQWESTTKFVNVEGMPKEVAAAMGEGATTRNCITPEDVKEANAGLFTGKEQTNCKQEGMAFKGGRISGKLTCTEEGQGTSTLEMDGQYTATTYDIAQKISTKAQDTSVVMETRTTGRRIGDCPAGDQANG